MELLYDPKFIGSFSSLELDPVPLNIVGADSEDDGQGTPMSFAFWDGGKVLKNKYFYTTSAEEACSFIFSYPIPSAFIFHNLEYDLANLFKHNDFFWVDQIIKAPLMLQVTLFNSKHVLMNSLSYFKGTLEQMGEIVGIKKLAGKARTQLNPEYVITDARIPYEYVNGFQNRLINDYGVQLSLSIGSIAMQVYRARFMDVNKQVTYNNPRLVNSAYYGGRVEVFYRGVTPDNEEVNVCDINSSYPNVMRNYEYPDTASLEKSSIHTHRFGVGHFRIHVPDNVFVPILPFKSPSGRLFFPTGTLTGYWTYIEVRKALEQGATILEEMDGIGTNEAVKPFVEFVDYFYGKRVACKDKAKRDKKLGLPFDNANAFESELLKNLLNNLYGKFAQKKPKTKLSRRPLDENYLEQQLGAYVEKRLGSFWEYVQEEGKPPKTANFLWAIHVTAYARIELLKHLEAVKNAGDTLLYCDTDSIMFSGSRSIPNLPINNSLGGLSHEIYDKGIFRQAKGYLLCDAKSCSLETKRIDEYEIKKVACKGVATTHAYEFIVEGLATAVKPMRFKEALIRTAVGSNLQKVLDKKIGFNVWRDVKKVMQSIDIKRSMGLGVTYPVDVSQVPMLEENATQLAENWSNKFSENPIFREAKEEYFKGVVPPEGWFRETGIPAELSIHDIDAKKPFYIRRSDLVGVEDGQVWFSGDVENIFVKNDRKYITLTLCAYFGEFFDHRDITALLPLSTLKILEVNEKIIRGKRIIVSKDDDGELQIEVYKNDQKQDLVTPEQLEREKSNEKIMEFLQKRGKVLAAIKK